MERHQIRSLVVDAFDPNHNLLEGEGKIIVFDTYCADRIVRNMRDSSL